MCSGRNQPQNHVSLTFENVSPVRLRRISFFRKIGIESHIDVFADRSQNRIDAMCFGLYDADIIADVFGLANAHFTFFQKK